MIVQEVREEEGIGKYCLRSGKYFALIVTPGRRAFPVLSRTVWQLAKPGGKTNLKRVGVLEIIYSVVFLVFVTLSFRAA